MSDTLSNSPSVNNVVEVKDETVYVTEVKTSLPEGTDGSDVKTLGQTVESNLGQDGDSPFTKVGETKVEDPKIQTGLICFFYDNIQSELFFVNI